MSLWPSLTDRIKRWDTPLAAVAPTHAVVMWIYTAALISYRIQRRAADAPLTALAVAVGLAVLWRPSHFRYALFAAADVVWVLATFDGTPSPIHAQSLLLHIAYWSVIGLSGVARARGRPFDAAGAFVPVLRAFFVIAVCAAGFAKLNHGFFDPARSCASVMYLYQRTMLGFGWLPATDWAYTFAIGLTIFAELLCPILVLLPWSRRFALANVWFFFLFVGLNPVNKLYEFSGLFVALSVLFIPPADFEAVWSKGRAFQLRVLAWAGTTTIRQWATRAVLLLFSAFFLLPSSLGTAAARVTVSRSIYVALIVTLFAMVLPRIARKAIPRWVSLRAAPAVFLLVPLLLVGHESLRYLGLRNDRTMSMAGNVVANVAYSDHFIVRAVPTFGLNRPVTIVESSSRELKKGISLTYIHFQEFGYQHPDLKVTFEYAGKTETLERVGDDPRFESGSLIARVLGLKPYYLRTQAKHCGHRRPRAHK